MKKHSDRLRIRYRALCRTAERLAPRCLEQVCFFGGLVIMIFALSLVYRPLGLFCAGGVLFWIAKLIHEAQQ